LTYRCSSQARQTSGTPQAARYGIGPESVVAFGDMPNDPPLLCWAGTSVAVANAHRDVLAAATHVVGSNDADGVAEYLEHLYR
jgi:hydroxymethylpyrimidine pyrophosphatase-like HAD family hydrolase